MSRILIFILIGAFFTTCVLSQGEDECADPHAVWNSCGSACPAVCGQSSRGRACIQVCVSGCFCKSPYSKDPKTGKCIKC